MNKRKTPDTPFKPPRKCQDTTEKGDDLEVPVITRLENIQASIERLHDLLLQVLQEEEWENERSSQSSDL